MLYVGIMVSVLIRDGFGASRRSQTSLLSIIVSMISRLSHKYYYYCALNRI